MARTIKYTLHLSAAVLRALLNDEQEDYEFTFGDENGGWNSETVIVKKGNDLPVKCVNKYVYKTVRIK